MRPLAERLHAGLAAEGPISVARLMALALLDRQGGYYATRDPLGAAGDFTTSPEISQCFGELIGAALAQAWLDRGRPAPVALVELGPGRGTLMADLLRAVASVPGFAPALALHLVEPSPVLRRIQAERLAASAPVFHDRLETVPDDRPLLLVANEVLDALPIRQFVRDARGWRERLVGLDREGRPGFLEAPLAVRPGPAEPALPADAPSGTVVELSPAREALVAEIARRLMRHGGLALLIDYGRLGAVGDSLQAVRGHRPVDPLACLGEADLSAHVDFAALGRVARGEGAAVFGPLPQGLFLERLGIRHRLERLARGRPAELRAKLSAGVERLVDPAAMGALFQVLALTRPGEPVPPGFRAGEVWPGPAGAEPVAGDRG